MEEDIEDLIKDIPEVLNITDLRITVAISTGTVDTHAIGASVTKLIAKFRRIEYLSIDIDKKVRSIIIIILHFIYRISSIPSYKLNWKAEAQPKQCFLGWIILHPTALTTENFVG